MGGNQYRARHLRSILLILTILGMGISGIASGVSIPTHTHQTGFSDPVSTNSVHGDQPVTDIITVGKNGSYQRLQVAIDNANQGDTIQVASGEYYRIRIDKEVTLKGIDTGGGKPVISAGNGEVAVYLYDGEGAHIENFVLKHADGWVVKSGRRATGAVFTNNTFIGEAGVGLFEDTKEHVFYANDFSEISDRAAELEMMDNVRNHWNSTQKITYYWNGERREGYLGNYYGDEYSDSNSDGIAESEHPMNYYPWKNTDRHPLVDEPWKYFEKGVGSSETKSTGTFTTSTPKTSTTPTTATTPPSTPTKETTSESPTEETQTSSALTTAESRTESTNTVSTTRSRGFFSNSGDGPALLDNVFNLTVVGFLLSVAGILHQMMGGR